MHNGQAGDAKLNGAKRSGTAQEGTAAAHFEQGSLLCKAQTKNMLSTRFHKKKSKSYLQEFVES